MSSSYKITVSQQLDLGRTEIDRIFHTRLQELTGGYWLRDGHLWEEKYTSHRFDDKVAAEDDPKYAVQVAALRLKQVLAEAHK